MSRKVVNVVDSEPRLALIVNTIVGPMVALAVGERLAVLDFDLGRQVGFEEGSIRREPFKSLKNWLDSYGARRPPQKTPKLELVGTPFQEIVWASLLEIPYGRATTYGGLAERIRVQLGRPAMSAQAVGQAVRRNPVALVVPCHRVVGRCGELIGYAGGVDRKATLLRHEGLLEQIGSGRFAAFNGWRD
ncbi:MAG: methylated-DNA--[protein]-cysteine S-methyltransferase [Deltaproteobacteria bacterium]|jgi:methylated-DNA-[protein]-cysteine S-methyltransferase|nr:methylated-DNA--[protein]-cysteine S-methyltransferase [Deltaproteobacteria bacterium]